MADPQTIRLKVTTDTADAIELGTRVKTAARDALTSVDVSLLMLDADAIAGTVAAAVLGEILRVRQATPAESATARTIERVRALHRPEYEACDWCSTNDRYVSWPCPTMAALDGGEQQ